MKKLLLLPALLVLSISSFPQRTPDSTLLRYRLFRASEFQNDVADICMVTSSALFLVTGKLAGDELINGRTTLQLVAVGAGLAGTGFLLQRISKQNAANADRIGLTTQEVILPGPHTLAVRWQAAIALRVPL